MNHKVLNINDFPALLKKKILLPDHPEFENARSIFNGEIGLQPAVIVLPETSEDVQSAIGFATENELPVSVTGGGHDWAGRALNEGGVVINLKRLKRIQINSAERTATVEGGVLAIELIKAAQSYDLVAVTGSSGQVGVAGLTLGGGYGCLSPKYGFAVDNLLSAEIVLSDGSLVTASEEVNEDLFWALRGSGGNFGVVTSLTIRLHPAKPILNGFITFSWSESATVLQGYNELIKSAPDELSLTGGLLTAPNGERIVYITSTWYGQPEDAEPYLESLRALGTPLVDQAAVVSYAEMLEAYDEQVIKGRFYHIHTRWISDLTDEIINDFVAVGHENTSRYSMVILHHSHGASTRFSKDETAFSMRDTHYLFEIIACWDPADNRFGADYKQWAKNFSAKLKKNALPGGYANLLGPENIDQIPQSYGDNMNRLQQIKIQYDPKQLFKSLSLPLSL